MGSLTEWFNDIRTRAEISWQKTITVNGTCNIHNGPTIRFASVTLEFTPSNELIVEDILLKNDHDKMYSENWYRAIVFGVVDVMLTTLSSPIRSYKLTIKHIEYSEIESTPIAFRLAARDAPQKAI